MVFVLILVVFYGLCIIVYNLTGQKKVVKRESYKRRSFEDYLKYRSLLDKSPLTEEEESWIECYEKEGNKQMVEFLKSIK